ncbi:putative oxidoreductase YteT [Hypsizygus marmoreus]|uniref:Oxidoreductase YteT n=1 Tax=Hypsizygus marmoreus TaxID=39966 RepID=A0A369JPZ6_HYPMA|nr:putative oxidoreductase YteT [Hypsizygus marmoreus]
MVEKTAPDLMSSILANLHSSNKDAFVPSQPVTLAIVGCGQRGKSYTKYALQSPDCCKVVAIAEPRLKTQDHFAKLHKVDQTLVFATWQDLHAASTETISTIGKRLADAVIIAVQDNMHLEVALAFAEQGYHILCEKPMATSLEDCVKMEAAIKKAGTIFGMGHVMRYSPYSREITNIIRSRSLGDLVNIVQVEPVGYYHFAHSYVRGNWASEATSSFSLMTKCCHDIDILCNWFSPSTPARVSSFGSLQHFRKSAKPKAAGSATKCLECPIEKECPYSAKKIYLEPVSHGNTGWPAETLVDGVPDIENITNALKTGPYGKCVYESLNDVCDHQVVNLEFANGSTASFTMVAYTSLICDRQTRLHFTHGEIVGDMSMFTVTDFRKRTSKVHHPRSEGGGHGGGDLGLIRAFVEAVATGRQEVLGTDVGEVLKSHLTVFAAETSRREGRVVDCVEFEREAREKVATKMI